MSNIALAYDLHIHSCLSPCGDDDMTPANIVGMAAVKQLDVIAVTDHNSCKNCPAVMLLAEQYGIVAIPGMELTTVEEVHVICLFPALSDAMAFDQFVMDNLQLVPNNEEIFGKQQIYNQEDEIMGTIPNLLINATNISFDQVYGLVDRHHGMIFPAHIDKNANSLLSNLGFVPPDSKFTCVEIKDMNNLHKIKAANPYIEKCRLLTNSDAHYLEYINEPDNVIYAKSKSVGDILEAISKMQ